MLEIPAMKAWESLVIYFMHDLKIKNPSLLELSVILDLMDLFQQYRNKASPSVTR